jgi:hypothetical protein
VTASIRTAEDGDGLAVDFEFTGGGYVIVRQDVAGDLDGNWEISFRVRGPAPTNHLEVKLVDPSGDNVWWSVRRDFEFGEEWRRVRVKKRHVQFAWGPRGGGEVERIGAFELAITAGSGGKGTVYLDDLEYRPLPVRPAVPPDPVASATSAADGTDAGAVLDDDVGSVWSPAPDDPAPALTLDLGPAGRELGALELAWAPDGQPARYAVEISQDGSAWETIREVEHGNGGLDPLFLPEQEGRYLRVWTEPRGSTAVALAGVTVMGPETGATREAFFGWIARRATRGSYPRGILGEQAYWTVVGLDGGSTNALLGEDGALEVGAGSFSIEPFVGLDDRLVTWADGEIVVSLAEGSLPVPTVSWATDDLQLDVTAFATTTDGVPAVVLRYELANRAREPLMPELYLAVRPFQVNPPSQSLNLQGGTARIRSLEVRDGSLFADGRLALSAHASPTAAGVASFDEGDVVVDHLRYGRVPEGQAVRDPFAAASGALVFRLPLGPGESRVVTAVAPLEASPGVRRLADPAAWVEAERGRVLAEWREKVRRVRLELPPEAAAVRDSFESQIGYILVNRSGPAIRPGTRSYARSWIRDGALTSSALLKVGHGDAAADFLSWYASYQYPDGKVPCVVDARGADPVPEHDSHGELVFLAAEVWRYGHDRALAEAMWPHVRAAADYLVALRSERLGPEWSTPGNLHFRGLLPPSISHEGYSAKPMHSYWDDFFGRVGFEDAAFLGRELGHPAEAAYFDSVRVEFEADLSASVERTLEVHGIDWVPGCADLGDFDATSTTIALAPTRSAHVLPADALARTFERYVDFFRARRDGEPWEAFTPYEIRNVEALVRLGRIGEAHEVLDWMLTQQRPAGWRQWPEVVRSDPREAGFLGDLPHGWVGSDYLRAVLSLFAIVEKDRIRIGPGIPAAWRDAEEGVAIRDLRTPFGLLSWSLRPATDGSGAVLRLEGDAPPGGIELAFPGLEAARATTEDGGELSRSASGAPLVSRLPATVLLAR